MDTYLRLERSIRWFAGLCVKQEVDSDCFYFLPLNRANVHECCKFLLYPARNKLCLIPFLQVVFKFGVTGINVPGMGCAGADSIPPALAQQYVPSTVTVL